MSLIKDIRAREIIDSRGFPTIETEVILECGVKGIASIPSGASTGSFEAVELRDGGSRFSGKGVKRAVENVNGCIASMLVGLESINQEQIDSVLIELDGTDNKAALGANAILSVSLAVCRAAAGYFEMPLYRYISGIIGSNKLPRPMMNILNGGAHADNRVDIQEFMLVPAKEESFMVYLEICTSIYHNLKRTLKANGLNSNIGDEGGVAPNLTSTREALDLIMQAIENCGYSPGVDVNLALDVAASELFKDGRYHLEGTTKDNREMIEYYENLVKNYPIISIEDPLFEEDWDGFTEMTTRLGKSIQIVGDDLFVTNKRRLIKGIDKVAANAILIKPNQIGTLTETIETVSLAQRNGLRVIISHRSGETCDSTISDLAVAVSAEYIKTGAPARGERVEKYNQLIRIEENLRKSSKNAVGEKCSR
ncbi:MAG: phosphopyruvate hydratase [Holosporales bacterium]|jgi:enolase|nr:phosphopyruvate hydratase [Holosporales bacterium]